MQLTGSQILLECLMEQGVDTVFGYPGGTILNVYDELYRYQDRIHHLKRDNLCGEFFLRHFTKGKKARGLKLDNEYHLCPIRGFSDTSRFYRGAEKGSRNAVSVI